MWSRLRVCSRQITSGAENVWMRNYSETHERVRHIPKKNYDQIKTGRMEIEPHIIDTPIVISNPLVKNEVLEVISTKGGDPLVKSYEETMHVDLPRKAHKAIVEGQVDDVTAISGVPEEQTITRRVRIFVPAKAATQAATHNSISWKIELDTKQRWENPLMGWCSNSDPLSNISGGLDFGSKEAAIRYCEKNGLEYEVIEPQPRTLMKKSYGNNYSWSKKTRVGTK